MNVITKVNARFMCLPVWTSLLCQHFESDLEVAKKTSCHRLRTPADRTDGQGTVHARIWSSPQS